MNPLTVLVIILLNVGWIILTGGGGLSINAAITGIIFILVIVGAMTKTKKGDKK